MRARIFWAGIFFLSVTFCCGQTASSIDTSKSAVHFLKNFYTTYITDIAIGHSLHSSDSLIKKYCTPRLLHKIAEHSAPEKLNGWDYDPFIKAQDCDTAVLKTLAIRTNKMNPNAYSVSYEWTDYFTKITTKTTIHLMVVDQKDGFRISEVW
jgi:hypothetical protein